MLLSGLISGMITEQETLQGVLLLHFGIKSSLQVNVAKEKVQVKRWKVILSAFCFLSVGYLFLINLIFVIAKADDVLSLFFDIVALVSSFYNTIQYFDTSRKTFLLMKWCL